jgi:hypothetical protein
VSGRWLRAAGAEEIMRPRRLIGRFWAALNFTVRRLQLGRHWSSEIAVVEDLAFMLHRFSCQSFGGCAYAAR